MDIYLIINHYITTGTCLCLTVTKNFTLYILSHCTNKNNIPCQITPENKGSN
jgi:hypothetical protein